MISEVTFSRGYSSFWNESFPWLNDYCRKVNQGLIDRINPPLQSLDDPKFHSINNIIAFQHFQNQSLNKEFTIHDAFDQSKSFIISLPRNNLEAYQFSTKDQDIVSEQVRRLISRFGERDLIFNPFFPGCGVMQNCNGDLLRPNTLAEIKAGERGLLPADIKQVIIYCALNSIAGNQYKFSNLEIYNPRQGISWESSTDDLFKLTSDLTSEELYFKIEQFLFSLASEIQL